MDEDVSAYMRLSMMIFMTAAFLSATVNVLIMGMSIMNSYSDKYTYNLAQGYLQNLISLQQEKYVAAPICHTAIDQAIDQVAWVILREDLNGDGDYLDNVTINGTLEPETQLLYTYEEKYESSIYSYNPTTGSYMNVAKGSPHANNIVLLMTKYKLKDTNIVVKPHTKLHGMYTVELEVVK